MKKNILLVVLTVLLLGSIALNVVFFRRGQQYYLLLNAVKLDPIGLDWYESSDLPSDTNQQRVVFFGDSRAYSWPAITELDTYQLVNRGIGNETTAQALERFDAHVAPLNPDIVVVQVGINDLKTIPLFPEQKASITADCKANIAAIVAKASDLEAQVVVTTIFPLGRVPLERRLFWSSDVAETIDEVNAYILTLAEERVVVFDTSIVLANERDVVQKAYSQDLLHLTPEGYTALNEKLLPILKNLQKGQH
ncbi:MAG: SGNH/GDSL hydrolase family protein [Anaerolineae bacterium]